MLFARWAETDPTDALAASDVEDLHGDGDRARLLPVSATTTTRSTSAHGAARARTTVYESARWRRRGARPRAALDDALRRRFRHEQFRHRAH